MKQQTSSRGCYFSLAFSIGAISTALLSLITYSPFDRISLQRGAFLSSLGFVYFSSLTDFINKFLLETSNGIKIRKKFRLKLSDVFDITNKLVSAVQALLSSLAGFIVCRYSCTISFLHASHFMSEAYAWFGAAYFFYDIWSMYKVHAAQTAQKITDKLRLVKTNQKSTTLTGGTGKGDTVTGNDGNQYYDKHEKIQNTNGNANLISEKQLLMDYETSTVHVAGLEFIKYMLANPIMMIHHIFLGSFGLAVIAYLRGGLGDCIFSYIYMMEISTPFVSLRSILSRLNMKSSRFYLINGLTMLATFFVFRVLLLPYLFYYYSQIANIPYFQAINSLPRSCKIGIAILFLPQYYWFYLMMSGAVKVFLPPKPTKSKSTGEAQITTKTKTKVL